MTQEQKPPIQLDEKALDAADAGSDKGYIVTQVEHMAATRTVRPKRFAIVDRTQL